MANSGRIEASISENRYTLRVDWTQSPDAATNTSTITAKLYLVCNARLNVGTRRDNPITIDGVQQTFSSPAINGKSTYLLATVTQQVAHNADGSKTAAISATYYIRATVADGYHASITASGSAVLDAIPRASTIGATDANIGTVSMIAVNRKSSAYTHSIAYRFGTLTGYIAADGSTSATELRYADTAIPFAVPESFYAQIPNAKTGVCTLICKTYSGTTQIGSAQSCTTTLTAPASACAPTVSGTVTDANPVTRALTGNAGALIRYYSTALCTISATAKHYATIAKRRIAGVTLSGTATTRSIANVETGSFVFEAVDSRAPGGYAAAATVSRTVVPYIRLTCNVTAQRTDQTSGGVVLQVKGDYYSGSFGAADNMLTLRVRVDGGEWISLLYVKNGNAYTSVSTLHGLDYTTEHTIEVSAADKLASVSRTAKVYKGVPIFDFGESDGILNVPMRFARGLDIVTGRGYASDLDADETALQAWLDTQLEAMADFSFRPIAWSCYPAITGSTVYGFLSRHEVGYGIFFGWSYDGHTYLLRKNRGVWSPAQASTDTGDSGGGTGSGGETSYGTCPAAASAAAKTGAIAGVTLETGACVLAQSQIQGAARGLCVLSPGTLRTLQAAAHEAFEAPVQARTEPVVELAAGVSGRAAEGARLNVWETPELCTLERTRAEAEGLLIADRGLDGAAALISGVKSVRASAVPAAAPAGEVAVCHRDNAASSLGMGARQQTGLHGKDAAAAECGTVWGLAEPVTGEAIPSANAALDLALEGKRGAFTRPKAAAQNASFSGAAAQSGIRPAVSALASGHGKAILAGGRSVSESAVRPETAPALSLSLAARSSVQAGAKLSAAEVESMAAQPGMGSSASCNLGLPLMQGAQGIVGLATQSAGDTGRGFGLASHTGAEAGTAVVLQSSAVSWKDPVQVGNRLTIYQSHHVTQSGARLRIQ